MPIREMLLGPAVAAVISTVLLLIGHRPWKRATTAARWPATVSIGCGFVAGYLVIAGWPGLPPQDQLHWLLPLAALVTLVGLVDALVRLPMALRVTSGVGCSIAVAWMLLAPLAYRGGEWGPGRGAAWIAAVSVVTCLSWLSLDRLAARHGVGSTLLAVTVVAGFAAAMLADSGSAVLLGPLGAAFTAALLPVLVAALRSPALSPTRGAPLVISVILSGLIINGHFWSGLTLPDTLLIAAAPHMCWIGQLPVVRKQAPWRRKLIFAAVLVPLITIALMKVIAVTALILSGRGATGP